MANEDTLKQSFIRHLPLGTGLAQLLTLIEMQVINVFKAIQLGFEKLSFERLAAIAGPLSKVSVIFLGIAVLIENILNFKRLLEMPDNTDDVQKTKTRLDTFFGLLKAAVVGIFTAVTFGVVGTLLVAAVLALPILTGIDCVCDAVKIGYDTYALNRKEKANEFRGEEGRIELEAAKEHLNNAKTILAIKFGIFVSAVMTVFPPTMLGGFVGIGLGFGLIVKQVFEGQEIEAKKEEKLKALEESRKPRLDINVDGREIGEGPVSPRPLSSPETKQSPRGSSISVVNSSSQGENPVSVANSFYSFFSDIGSAIGEQMQSFGVGITGSVSSPTVKKQ